MLEDTAEILLADDGDNLSKSRVVWVVRGVCSSSVGMLVGVGRAGDFRAFILRGEKQARAGSDRLSELMRQELLLLVYTAKLEVDFGVCRRRGAESDARRSACGTSAGWLVKGSVSLRERIHSLSFLLLGGSVTVSVEVELELEETASRRIAWVWREDKGTRLGIGLGLGLGIGWLQGKWTSEHGGGRTSRRTRMKR